MTDKEILTKAIEKAEKNGWKNPYNSDLFSDWSYDCHNKTIFIEWDIYNKNGLVIANNHPADEAYIELSVSHIIFDQEFAKAFWGEKLIYTTLDEEYMEEAWIVHLQQMVLEEEPLKYLEKFL